MNKENFSESGILSSITDGIDTAKNIINNVSHPENLAKNVISNTVNPMIEKEFNDEVDVILNKIQNKSPEIIKASSQEIKNTLIIPSIYKMEESINRIILNSADVYKKAAQDLINPMWKWIEGLIFMIIILIVVIIFELLKK
jgi:hypothetical protein